MSLVIGAAGAIGKRLINGLTSRGDHVIAALRRTPLPDHLQIAVAAQEMGVNVTDVDSLRAVFKKHPTIHTVWNLEEHDPGAAEPKAAESMSNILQVMRENHVRKMVFTDSIGSFGATAPREKATANWLTKNPKQDPESEYGLQKRACRELMRDFTIKEHGDTRFAVVPGVLHADASWGEGVTEYALDALDAACDGRAYSCPVGLDVKLPMIYMDDLVRGLMALEGASSQDLKEPEQGYAIAGFSFTPRELFEELQQHGVSFETKEELNANMNKFANLWCDSLSPEEAQRDFGYSARIGLSHAISRILRAHTARREPGAAAPELSSTVAVP